MREILNNLYVGDENDCRNDGKYAVVHACKHPCHTNALGYKGSLPKDHKHYLHYTPDSFNLYLNIIDPPVPLFDLELFEKALSFIDTHYKKKPILIHCNKGESRSASIALLYLAKRREINNDSYLKAKNEYTVLDLFYSPGEGIKTFLQNNWNNLII